MSEQKDTGPNWMRIGMLLVGYVLIIGLGYLAGVGLERYLGEDPLKAQGSSGQIILLIGLLVFIVFLSLPFVPGIEISLALFAAFGTAVVVPLYFATMAALIISYSAGRYIPFSSLAVFFEYIGLRSAGALVRRLAEMEPHDRFRTLVQLAPGGLAGFFIRHREVALITALNVPGNALFGGGGGIALVAGMSGLFPFGRFLLAIAIASIPIPLSMAIAGLGFEWYSLPA